MSDLIHRPAAAPPGARTLGVRVKPALRLAIGYRDEAKRGAPTKVDYFIPKIGSEGEFARAAEKFRAMYGERPKAIDIRLPDELRVALDIRYKAFAGGGGEDGEGGVMIAKGDTNFAEQEWAGGADMITVWRPDGTVEDMHTAGVDGITGEPLDDVAKELGLALYTTFRFGIPSVLGYGSFCEITSKGKTTTDSLWLKLRGWYGSFGPRTSWVIRPTLFVRPSTARPVIKMKDGTKKRIKSKIYALDLVLNEGEDELLGRLREHAELTRAVSGSLWSGNITPDEAEVGDPVPGGFDDVRDLDAGDLADAEYAETVDEIPDHEPALPESLDDEVLLTAAEKKRLPQSEEAKPPHGTYQTYSLKKILSFGDQGKEWLAYALRQQDWSAAFMKDLLIFCKAHTPDVYGNYLLSQEGEINGG